METNKNGMRDRDDLRNQEYHDHRDGSEETIEIKIGATDRDVSENDIVERGQAPTAPPAIRKPKIRIG